MIGLSPLSTAHPGAFQRPSVRASIPCYRDFTLAMDSSLGFASAPAYCGALFGLAFAAAGAPEGLSLAGREQLVGSLCKRHAVTPAHWVPRLRPLVSARFQVLFHSPSRRSFHLSLTVLVRYRSWSVFSLAGWCRRVQTGFLRSRPTQGTRGGPSRTSTGLSPSVGRLSSPLRLGSGPPAAGPTTPPARVPGVWAAPRSLATTEGITDLFSVPGGTEMFQFPPLASPTRRVGDLPARSCRKGLPHSETRGSTLVCSFPRLFAALRVLPRLTMPRHPPCALLMLTLYGLHGKPSSMTLDLLPPGVWVCMRLRPHPPWRRATRPRTHNLLVWMCCMCMCYESISFTTSKNSKKNLSRNLPPLGSEIGERGPDKTGRPPQSPIPQANPVELRGVEPRTPCLQSRCSGQLSYSPFSVLQ